MTNLVILIGNMGKDPESRTTEGGTKISRFTLATSRPRYENKQALRDERGFRVQNTAWHRITCFNALANSVETYCRKGMKLAVRGRLNYSEYTDAGGIVRYGVEIIAESIEFLSRGEKSEEHVEDNVLSEPSNGFSPNFDDEIPF